MTRFGFGVSVAPKLLAAIFDYAFSQDEIFSRAASAYIDDIYINEACVNLEVVAAHFRKYRLVAKEPTRLGCSEGMSHWTTC